MTVSAQSILAHCGMESASRATDPNDEQVQHMQPFSDMVCTFIDVIYPRGPRMVTFVLSILSSIMKHQFGHNISTIVFQPEGCLFDPQGE